MNKRGLAALLAAGAWAMVALLGGCASEFKPDDALPPEITVTRVRKVLPFTPTDAGTQRLVSELSRLAGGRMDALHVALPSDRASDFLVHRLAIAGVRPRKIRRGASWGTVVAERYLAGVPPCPLLGITGAAWGGNETRPGFGCSTLANIAADTSDPADLLGNPAAEAPDAERAAITVARWRALGPPPALPGPPPAAR